MNSGRLSLGWAYETEPSGRREPGLGRSHLPYRTRSQFRLLLSTVSFWGAIGLPALYLPLLFRGIDSLDGLGLFLVLFGVHVLALIGGHDHHE